MRVYDISEIYFPELFIEKNLPGFINDIEILDNFAFTSNNNCGISKINLLQCCKPAGFSLLLPKNNSLNQPLDILFKWEGSNFYNNYSLYFGESPSPPLYSTNISQPQFNVNNLLPDKTYYWKVESSNYCGSFFSEEWNFKTQSISCSSNLGDVSENLKISSIDASFVLQYVVDIIGLSDSQRCKADVDENSKVSAMDASNILKCSVGLCQNLPQNFRQVCSNFGNCL